MKANLRIRQALSMCLTATVLVTYSMVALAAGPKASGEILISGNSIDGNTPSALVNGETVKTGRTIFSSSTISTPEGVTAVLKLGKAGVLELGPNSSVAIEFDDQTIKGSISSGTVKVIAARDQVNMNDAAGLMMNLLPGETATATGKAQDDDDDNGGAAWWLWAIVFGGAAAGIIYAATRDSNSTRLGGNGTVISPTF
jgi:hypothetical protein